MPNYISLRQREQFFSANYTQKTIDLLSQTIRASLQDLTNAIIHNTSILLYFYLAYAATSYIVLHAILHRRLSTELYRVKSLVTIIPQQTYITNPFLQSDISMLMSSYNLASH